jgi:peptidoglycan/xylan/chitin deacetylase (PgdA/CDA1 family)
MASSRSIHVLTAALIVLLAPPVVADSGAVVLMYHRFGEDRFPSTSIRVEQFEAHLQHLRDGGYTVVPLTDVLDALAGGRSLPCRAVAITIDDAYRSVYDVAFPLLAEHGFPFTVFVATDPVDQGLAAYMSWDQMREMATHGASFANHGASHESWIARRPDETDGAWRTRVTADVSRGWRRLSAELEPIPSVFAYPYGEYDRAAAELLRESGYVAFGQQSGATGPLSDRRALPRFPLAEAFGDMDSFRTKVASLPLPVEAVVPWDPVVTTDRPSVEVTLGDTLARSEELACFVSGQGRVEPRWIESDRRFSVAPEQPLGPGRQRVNCTAPRDDGRYFWFSHPWIVRKEPAADESPARR